MSIAVPRAAIHVSGRASTFAAAVGHPTYRPDIDGLRALAVLSVVGFHAFSFWIPGGFIGVDIFFVISGYLITTIIVGDIAKQRFTYRGFYARRIKRILPALVTVLVSVAVAGWVLLLPSDYRHLGRHLVGGSTFLSNFVLRGEGGYFDNDAETKPLLHLWSLAIEEQFYIFWPLILAVAARRFASIQTIVVIAAASFAFSLSTLSVEPVLSFYSPFSRFWELMAGGVLAHVLRARPAWFERHRDARSLAGFALILAAVFLFARWDAFPGWRALLPVTGAFLIISAGGSAWPNRMVLGNRAAVWVGKISYPLYLWHWPLLSFAAIAYGDALGLGVRVALVALAFALAWLTYRYIETPVRGSTDFGGLPLRLLVGLAIVGVFGFAAMRDDGFAFRKGDVGAYAARYDDTVPEMRFRTDHRLFAAFREECNFYDFDASRAGRSTSVPRVAIDPTCYTRAAGTTRAVLIWGDSHAQHLNMGLREILPPDVALLQVASSGCGAALVEPDAEAASYCAKSNRFALSVIRKEKPDVVVIAQREGHDLRRFRDVARTLLKDGVKAVVVVGPVPQWKPALFRVVANEYWKNTPDRLQTHLDPGTTALERQLKTGLKPDEPFVYVDLFDALCNEHGCRTMLDGDRVEGLMTFDYGHFTPRASSFVARTVLAPRIMGLMDGSQPATLTP